MSSYSRRTLLKTGCTVLVAGLAGCLSDSEFRSDGSEDDDPEDEDSKGNESNGSENEIGDGERSTIFVSNSLVEGIEYWLSITTADGTVVLSETDRLDPNESMRYDEAVSTRDTIEIKTDRHERVSREWTAGPRVSVTIDIGKESIEFIRMEY